MLAADGKNTGVAQRKPANTPANGGSRIFRNVIQVSVLQFCCTDCSSSFCCHEFACSYFSKAPTVAVVSSYYSSTSKCTFPFFLTSVLPLNAVTHIITCVESTILVASRELKSGHCLARALWFNSCSAKSLGVLQQVGCTEQKVTFLCIC